MVKEECLNNVDYELQESSRFEDLEFSPSDYN